MPQATETLSVQFTVNGKPAAVQSDGRRSLLEVLREDLHLTGTKYGCGEGACGACTVLVDGRAIFSCTTPMKDIADKQVTTIEGLEADGQLHPVQKAFLECNAFQCGYCTPGQILGAVALLASNPNPDDQAIREGMNNHICRCCSYLSIFDAVKRAAEASRTGGSR